MSRYIDGTWLKKFFEADKGKGRVTPIDSLLALIDDAPTAECFTCGMERVKDEKYGSLPTLVYDPQDVSDEVLETNDRLVSLADVCKLIKREWQINPHQWGELARLPSVECGDCIWNVCNYNKVDWPDDTPQTDLTTEEFVEGMKNLRMEVKQTDCPWK